MTEALTEVDRLLLSRWTDAVSFREAMQELEERLSGRLEAAVESLRSWLDEQGFGFLEVETKYARINVARRSWMNKKKQPYVWFTLDAVFPYGYMKVEEECPYVWVDTRNLDKNDRSTFQEHLTSRLRGKEGDWLNEDCNRDYPAGRYILTHGDRERVALAQEPEALTSFLREVFTPILALANDVEAALRATLGK